jgi:hypothetical protein
MSEEMNIMETAGKRLGNWSSWVAGGHFDGENESHTETQGLVDRLQSAYDSKNEKQLTFWTPIVEEAFREAQDHSATGIPKRIMSRQVPLDPTVDRTADGVNAHIAALYTQFATDNPEILEFVKVSGQGLVHTPETYGSKMGADASKLQKDGYRTFIKASKSPEDLAGGNYYITTGKNGIKTITVNGLEILDLSYVPKADNATNEGGES